MCRNDKLEAVFPFCLFASLPFCLASLPTEALAKVGLVA